MIGAPKKRVSRHRRAEARFRHHPRLRRPRPRSRPEPPKMLEQPKIAEPAKPDKPKEGRHAATAALPSTPRERAGRRFPSASPGRPGGASLIGGGRGRVAAVAASARYAGINFRLISSRRCRRTIDLRQAARYRLTLSVWLSPAGKPERGEARQHHGQSRERRSYPAGAGGGCHRCPRRRPRGHAAAGECADRRAARSGLASRNHDDERKTKPRRSASPVGGWGVNEKIRRLSAG